MLLVNQLKASLDHPLLFNLVQLVVSGRQEDTRQRIHAGLRLRPGELLLDVCCGTGEFADVARGPYLGIDLNAHYIAYARRKYGAGAGHPEREFIAADITVSPRALRGRQFPKAMMINAMHHLSEEATTRVLATLARMITDRLVIVDMDPTPGQAISRFLARQDRGAYIRALPEQIALTAPHFIVEQATTYYSGWCGQTILICATKKASYPRAANHAA